MFRLVIAALVLIAFAKGQTCESPQFKVVSHSTRDARLAAEPAAQLEITVKCKSGKQVRCFLFDFIFKRKIFAFSQLHFMQILMDKLFLVRNRFHHLENTM
jgi:hypothetical protein